MQQLFESGVFFTLDAVSSPLWAAVESILRRLHMLSSRLDARLCLSDSGTARRNFAYSGTQGNDTILITHLESCGDTHRHIDIGMAHIPCPPPVRCAFLAENVSQ